MIPKHYFKEIRRVKIRTRRLAADYLAGAYRSVFKGRGMDFEDVRAYQAGDDVRHIDWNVSARMNSIYVKEFKEERELKVIIAVDVSGSGEVGSGTQTKRDLAAEVAACIAYSAIANGDKVGLVLFSDKIEQCVLPGKGRTQALRIIREVLYRPASHAGTSLKKALNFVNHTQRRRAIVFLISDFLDDDFDRQLKVTARRHDLIPILVTDAREQTLPDVGWIVVNDAETGATVEVDTSNAATRERYAQTMRERHDNLKQRIRRAGTELVELTTDGGYLGPIHRYMEQRMTRRSLA